MLMTLANDFSHPGNHRRRAATGAQSRPLVSSLSRTRWENTGKGILCRPDCDSAAQSDILFSTIMAEFIQATATNHFRRAFIYRISAGRPKTAACLLTDSNFGAGNSRSRQKISRFSPSFVVLSFNCHAEDASN